MSIDRSFLLKTFAERGVSLEEEQAVKFEKYAKTLVEWNEKVNLTAITQPEEIVVKHFYDSILLLDAIEVKENSSLIDVGTGAGFPSIPCKILREDLKITLLDSLNKRISFLKALCDELEIESKFRHARAEDAGRDKVYREKYDIATARAVANLTLLAEYCLPFVKVGGIFIALKGSEITEELESAKKSIKKLGGQVLEVKSYDLPDGSKRNIVLVKKISQISPQYPRNSAQIKKTPI